MCVCVYIYILSIFDVADHLLLQHTTTYLSSHYYMSTYSCVPILLHMCMCVLILPYVSSQAGGTRCVPRYYILYVSSYYCVCSYICVLASRRHVMRTSRTTLGRYGVLPHVSSYYYMCPHTTVYVSSHVLILL